MKKIAICLVLLCTACAYSRPLYMDENGQMVYEAFCNGNALNVGDCYIKAREDCPHGFEVKDKETSDWHSGRSIIYTCKSYRYQTKQYPNTNNQYYRYR
ncbi:MAG: hypothetical protein IJZ30_05970 [Alphaproteobacteria bacterium]|nr:hypothetical protein [Alphaproteobacteria bacterium]